MSTFFLDNTLCFTIYLLVVVLFMLSVFMKRFKAIPMLFALALFLADVTYLLIMGISLEVAAILCGICVILALISIREGRNV